MNSAQRLSPRQELEQISIDLAALAGQLRHQTTMEVLRGIKARIKVLRKSYTQDQYRQLADESRGLRDVLQSHHMLFHARMATQLSEVAAARKTIEVAAILARLERNIQIAILQGGRVLSTQG